MKEAGVAAASVVCPRFAERVRNFTAKVFYLRLPSLQSGTDSDRMSLSRGSVLRILRVRTRELSVFCLLSLLAHDICIKCDCIYSPLSAGKCAQGVVRKW